MQHNINSENLVRDGRESEAAVDRAHAASMEEMGAMLVDSFHGQPITRGLFKAAFEKVAPKENWKLPIDAEVDVAGDFEIYVLKQAVIFFTACVPDVRRIGPGRCRVVAAGYYAAVGA